MDDLFNDEDTQLIVATIEDLCRKLEWTMRLVSVDDAEGGIGGIILGNEEFFGEIGLDETELPEDDQLH